MESEEPTSNQEVIMEGPTEVNDNIQQSVDEIAQSIEEMSIEDSMIPTPLKEIVRKSQIIQDEDQFIECIRKSNFDEVSCSDLYFLMQTKNDRMMIISIIGCRKLLSFAEHPRIQDFIDCGFVPIFINLLNNTHNNKMIVELLWTFTNVASGIQSWIDVLMDNKFIPLALFYCQSEV